MWLEKNEEDSFYTKQFRYFSLSKIKSAAKDGICWYPVIFEKRIKYEDDMIKVSFHLPQNMTDEHAFQPAGSIKIFNIDIRTGSIRHITEGIIDIILKKKVEVSYAAKKPLTWIEQEEGIGIHLSFSKYTYSVMEKALDDIYKAKDNRLEQLRDIMMGKQKASFLSCDPYKSEWLNLSQQTAVNHILSSQDIALVHGPPGTGKTTTLVEAIIETLKTETQIMVCAYNNIAVDVIAEKLLTRGVSVVRIGNPAKVTDELLNVTYETKFCEHPYYTDVMSCNEKIKQLKTVYVETASRDVKTRKKIKSEIYELTYCKSILELSIKSSIFKESKVVAATMIGAANKILKDISFSTVFIDEAAQALEPACWAPIAKARRVIFAGDHKQLPPTIKSYEAAQAGLMHTLFEKIIGRCPECATLLTMQYRMHESIMTFSSQWFYESQLLASATVKNKTLIDSDIPVVWVDTAQCDCHEKREINGTSIYNIEEVDLMFLTLFEYMEKIGGEARILAEKITFGLISPYSAQIDLIRQKIKENYYFEKFLAAKLISIRTIDGFQGQEREVIAISLVRSNLNYQIGFLADYRRINVAMTRARKKLFLIGDSSTLREDPFFEDLYLYVQKNGSVTELSPKSELDK